MRGEESARVGIIGLGMMGGGIAMNLIAAGLDCSVHDIRSEMRDSQPAFGGVWCDSPREVAERSDVVLIVVVTAEQVESVLFGPSGLCDAEREGLVAGVCSTIDLDDLRRIDSRARAHGIAVLDVGLSGGPEAAVSGSLVTTIGGPIEAFRTSRTALSAISGRAIHAGPSGSGMKLKLLKNALSFSVMSAVHECAALGERLGFDNEMLRVISLETNLLDHFFWYTMSRPSASARDDIDADELASASHFAAIAAKDLDAAINLAVEVDAEHRELDLAKDRVQSYFLLPESPKD